MNASIVTAIPGLERSMQVGPPLPSMPPVSGWTRPVPASGSAVDRSGGPSTPLARCVGDVAEFSSKYWGRRPLLHTPNDGTDTFDDVFSLQALDELVAHGARLPAIRMVADGVALAPSQFCSATRLGGRDLDDVVDPVKVIGRLADGATLVMQSLHRTSKAVGDFVTRLQDELSHPVQANAYLTPPDAVGLAEHSDLHDVLAVQLHGSKRWWVDGLGDVTMRRGDVMYVPRGIRHRAGTTTETSLHLTIGIIRVTARQVIERILRDAPGSLDQPLPIGYRDPSRRDALARDLHAALATALDLIGSTDVGAVVDQEQSRRLARPPMAGRISSHVQLEELDADVVIQWSAPQECLAQAVDEVDGRRRHGDGLHSDDDVPAPAALTVHLGDRTLTMPITAQDALRALSDGRPIRVGDLPGLDEPSRIVLAKRLVRETACIVSTVGWSSSAECV